jgi:hypothetical protein
MQRERAWLAEQQLSQCTATPPASRRRSRSQHEQLPGIGMLKPRRQHAHYLAHRRIREDSEQSDTGARHSQIQRQSTDTRGESEDSNSPIVALPKVKNSTNCHIGWHRPCLRTAHAFEPSMLPRGPGDG